MTAPWEDGWATGVADRLLVCGFGGLQQAHLEEVVQRHAVTHIIVCGHPGQDAYVDLAVSAASASGGLISLHVAPLVPSDKADVGRILEEARCFIEAALSDEFAGSVLVACSRGASRSVSVALSYLIVTSGYSLKESFNAISSKRWCLWPSALLVTELLRLETLACRSRGNYQPTESQRLSAVRCIGVHAAWATAKHNGREVFKEQAESAWDAVVSELDMCSLIAGDHGPLEAAFRRCKESLLGVSNLGQFIEAPSATIAHSQVDEVEDDLLICGFGGMSVREVSALLAKQNVTHVVICGKPEDKHTRALQEAVDETIEVHAVPVADSDTENILVHLDDAIGFIQSALADGLGRVVVACRQGASRSATVILAYLMSTHNWSLAIAFTALAEKRWRVWPNAGFVRQLLSLKNGLQGETESAFRMVGCHAAWATNRQNLEKCGVGQKGLKIQEVQSMWDEIARQGCASMEEHFEICKMRALGVNIDEFDSSETPCSKRPKLKSE